jgi:glyoxylase-like metal-dependent hydrolase (beta-lactamase superfamily II)
MMRGALTAVLTIVLLAGAAGAQPFVPGNPRPDFNTVQIKTTDLGNRTYQLEGEGGNVVVAVGDDGVIMIDNMFGELHDKLKAAIAKLTPQPIRYVVLTHFHRDHAGGNEAFAKDGAVIVAHDNIKQRLAAGTINRLTGNEVPPAPADALPTQTFRDSMTVRVRGRTAELKYHANTHSDGDTTIHFADAQVFVTGDIVFFGRYPNIDFAYNGSIDGMIRGVDEVLAMVTDDMKIVPGHGPVGTKAQVREFRQMLVDARDRISRAIAAGMTEDQVVAAKPNADYDAKLGVNAQQAGNFVRVVYRSLKK